MIPILRVLALVGFIIVSPLVIAVCALCLGLVDLCFFLFGKRRLPDSPAPRRHAATVVIPNWNGRDLLEKFLPSVVTAMAGHPDNEIIVVDNASSDDSVRFLQEQFPGVRVLAQTRNLGFGGGSNAGFAAARNDIVVLLNSDMRVEADFLAPLLEPFADPLVFSVSCQIFFPDLTRRREETGLTEAWWEDGRIRVSHRDDPTIREPFPCAYTGGGSSAIDRRKFLELGGFDDLLRPFYYEDTDLGYMAWKRGWKTLYQPSSIVYHEHRGTIGKKFSRSYIEGILKKNIVLYCWKNIHNWGMLCSHLAALLRSSVSAHLTGQTEGRYTFAGLMRASLQLGDAMGSRWRARSLAAIRDREAFRRPLAAYYWDRFEAGQTPPGERLNVLFAAPYAIEPPTHGGAVFMKQTLNTLARLADVHLLCFVDTADQIEDQQTLVRQCKTAQFVVRNFVPLKKPSTLLPHAVREFASRDFAWMMHRTVYQEKIDIVQLEYTVLGQYAGQFEHFPCLLFEHDIFFQSLRRGMKALRLSKRKAIAMLEYARMLRYELKLLPQMTRVQTCSRENTEYLLEYLPALAPRIDSGLRAAVDTALYRYVEDGREADTMLFVGSFSHMPNREALDWFTGEVLPRILKVRPESRFVVVGSNPPPALRYLNDHPNIELTGFVPDIRTPLERYAVFVCPILSGSGVRVKLLEAFAAGIPCVSTRLGAEGLITETGQFCELADTPESFASATVRLLEESAYARQLARRAREMVTREKDSRILTERLEAAYRTEVERLRPPAVISHRSAMAAERA